MHAKFHLVFRLIQHEPPWFPWFQQCSSFVQNALKTSDGEDGEKIRAVLLRNGMISCSNYHLTCLHVHLNVLVLYYTMHICQVFTFVHFDD